MKPPCSILLLARFFDPYPNWEHARVLGPHSERLFFTKVSFPRYAPPTPQERDVLWQWLNRGSTDRRLPYEMLTAARIKMIYVENERVSTNFRGIVTNVTRLGGTLDALRRLAAESVSR